MALNSRQKGKAGELEAAQALRDLFGWECGRSVQHSGTQDSADLRVSSTPGLWIEVKRVERLCVPKTMATAVKQCGRKTPVLLHRPNRSPVGWMLTIRLSDLPALAHAYDAAEGVPMAAPQVPSEAAGADTGGAETGRHARRVPASARQGSHSDSQGHARDDGGNSSGRMGTHPPR